MFFRIFAIACAVILCPQIGQAQNAARELQKIYATQGAVGFSAERGGAKWGLEVQSKSGDKRSCSTCHGADLAQAGQHIKTKKNLEPMAFSVNKERYIKTKKIQKWFKRNCKWTWGRECTVQEKGDFLEYLLAQ